MKNICILHTGGTFGMAAGVSYEEGHPNPMLGQLLAGIPELASLAHIQVQVLCNIDSSNASSEIWLSIVNAIVEQWDQFDGFVVIHGTDTMAWTTAAVAYLLEGLTKPVVFTGSQRPLRLMRNDARANIIDAVELATIGIPEVVLCFDSKVHRATRLTKYSNEHLYAFKSYNSPLLGRFGVNFKLNAKIASPIVPLPKRVPPFVRPFFNTNIAVLTGVPGMALSQTYTQTLLNTAQGIVLRGFGTGNLPTREPSWVDFCQAALEKEIPVVMTTQCQSGFVALGMYENGQAYASVGVISGKDMTFEAASIKLMIMLGRQVPFQDRQEFFQTPLAFECSS